MEDAERNSRIRSFLMSPPRLISPISIHILAVAVILFFSTVSLSGCANHPCREPKAPELDQTKSPQSQPAEETSSLAAVAASGASTSTSSKLASGEKALAPNRSGRDADSPKVRVFKPDGSKQCEKKGAVSVESMERELSGIPVFAKDKRSDGLMHVQVCGSPTGMINTFEIDLKNLKKAEERGFRRLEE